MKIVIIESPFRATEKRDKRSVPRTDFSPSAVCERARHRRSVLSGILDGPGSDEWKLRQVRLFIEEADGDETVEQVAEREPYIWKGDTLWDIKEAAQYGGVLKDENVGGHIAYRSTQYIPVWTGTRDECMLALEKHFLENRS